MNSELLQLVRDGNMKAIARSISLIENEVEGYEQFLSLLPPSNTRIIGITGPPGAGKSTLVDALIKELIKNNQSVAILCVDPSSPFSHGALLGDRIRMSEWYNHPKVYIRSLATRGALGGLHPKIMEISDLLKAAPYDHIIIETVGVGQSEIQIAALADTTVVVVVPESGDEIQTMKAGLMEIADIFVVNKADRPGADLFVRNLQLMLTATFSFQAQPVHIIKTIASQNKGIDELMKKIISHQQTIQSSDKKYLLVAERAYYLIQSKRMKDVDKALLISRIKEHIESGAFNLYKFIQDNFI